MAHDRCQPENGICQYEIISFARKCDDAVLLRATLFIGCRHRLGGMDRAGMSIMKQARKRLPVRVTVFHRRLKQCLLNVSRHIAPNVNGPGPAS